SSSGSGRLPGRRAGAVAVCPSAEPLEGDVVVRAGGEVGVLGLCGRARGDELRLAAALGVTAAAEELDAVGDDLHRLALRSVLRVPLAPLEAAVDCDRAALAEILRAALALVAPDGDVEVVRLLGPLAGRAVLTACVDGEPQAADRGPARRVAQL